METNHFIDVHVKIRMMHKLVGESGGVSWVDHSLFTKLIY